MGFNVVKIGPMSRMSWDGSVLRFAVKETRGGETLDEVKSWQLYADHALRLQGMNYVLISCLTIMCIMGLGRERDTYGDIRVQHHRVGARSKCGQNGSFKGRCVLTQDVESIRCMCCHYHTVEVFYIPVF
jgi:hypothetical protein